MSAVSTRVAESLEAVFGADRVRTDQRERKMYSFDIGAMPSLVKPFMPAGIAGAVVRPQDEAQVVELMRLAREQDLRLVPRAWATSGYGGVLPQKGAVVVDVSGMTRVLQGRCRGDDGPRASRCHLGGDRPGHRARGPHPAALPVVVPEFVRWRLARAGWQRVRQLRVRDLQGERGLRARRRCRPARSRSSRAPSSSSSSRMPRASPASSPRSSSASGRSKKKCTV